MVVKQERNASFELLRLLCMLMIVFYHFIIHTDAEWMNHESMRLTSLPLHVAVVCFVLITGYWGVRLTMQKVCTFLSEVVFYGVVLYVVGSLAQGYFSWKGLCTSFMPLTHNPDLWFVRTYFLFLLFSPLANKWLQSNPSPRHRLAMVLLLGFISVYVGWFGQDPSLCDGKNVVHFTFLYLLGHELRVTPWVQRCSAWCWLAAYGLFSAILCVVVHVTSPSGISEKVWWMAFSYNGPLLVVNALFFFLFFAKLQLRSRAILLLAQSSFAIYLIHSNLHFGRLLWQWGRTLDACWPLKYAVLTLLVTASCIVADRLLKPVYGRIASVVGSKIAS